MDMRQRRKNCGVVLSKGAPVFVRTGTDVHSLGTLLETPSEGGGGDCLVQVRLRDEDSPRRVDIGDVLPANASDASDAEDVCSLSFLHEPAVTHNLRVRYERSEIYTRAGPVLVAVNPFREIEGLYSSETAARYAEQEKNAASLPKTLPSLPPHIFETASRAYSAMVASGKSQSIIISGESGAGKTESAKLALRQVAALAAAAAAAAATASSSSSSSSSSNVASAAGDEFAALEAAILATNPILESFGNAKTSRNDNSSRFGKLIELLYSEKKGSSSNRSRGSGTFAAAAAAPPPSSFVVSGARLSTCLLERSRLVARPKGGERNFHILYQLVAGADGALREELRLPPLPPKEEQEHDGSSPSSLPPPPFSFRYLSGGPSLIEGVDDAAEFRRVAEALSAVGVGGQEQRRIWRALAGILHLGDVDFSPAEQGEASEVSRGEEDAGRPSSLAALENAAALLGVRAGELERVLTTKEITAGGGSGGGGGARGGRRKSRGGGGGDRVVRRLRPDEARSSRDALAKAVYSCLFDWLVARINRRLAPEEEEEKEEADGKDNGEKKTSPSISLLDIYGFECFEENGFEQLCINYANEHLQAQFNSVLLALEQEAYEGEGVDFSRVEWRSNEETLAALDSRPGSNNNNAQSSSSSSSPRFFSVGLLALLDEACLVPGGTDAGFGLRVSEVLAGGGSSSSSAAASTPSSAKASAAAAFASSSSSSAVVSGCPAGSGASFSVAHAAGKVSYSTSGFLSKNKDVVSAEALALLSKFSTEPLLKEIAEAATTGNSNGNGSSNTNNNNATVVSAFRLQLRSLLSRLGASQLHFVRCIKPNAQARADCFDGALVAHQLRCAGVAEVARVARQGFPTRAPFSEIANRFSALVFPPLQDNDDVDDDRHRAAVAALLSSRLLRARLGDEDDSYALGRTKAFMRAGVLAALEAELRVRSAAATAVSARFRGRRQRKRFLEARRSAVAIQAAVRGRAARKLVEEKREERRRAEEAAKEEEERAKAAAANAAAAASLTVERSSCSAAASVLRGAEKLVEAADAEAAAAAKRAASGEVKRSGSGKWQLPRVPISLRRGSRSNEGGVSAAAAAPATPRPPPASSSSGGAAATEVALWEAYAERLEAQVSSLLRTNRALQGSLAAARADARSAVSAAAAAAGTGGNGKKSKSCFSSCSSSVVVASPSSSSPTRSAAAEHAASLRALDALRESLEKREALFEDDAAFLAEVASGAVAAAPGFQLLEETRRLRKRFSSFVGSFSGRMEATEVVVLGAAEAKREQAAAAAGGGGGVESKRDFLIAAAAASPLQEGGGKIATSERRGTAVVSLEARAA